MPGPTFLAGDRVWLHPIEEDDCAFLQRGWNHPDVRPGFGGGRPRTEGDIDEMIEALADDDTQEGFLVCASGEDADAGAGEDSDPTPVGEAFLFDLHEASGNVELGYWIDPDHQGNGYATETVELVLDYCFDERRLHKVNARVLAFNEGSKHVLEKVGFRSEGRRREDFYVDGEYVDADLYGITAAEWENRT
jgi:RimJ/RimL family protein N-acetyltransferase